MQAKTNANLQVGLQKIYKEGLDAFGDKSYFKDIKLTESGVNLSSIASGAYQVSVGGRLNFKTSNEETSWLILEVGDLIYTVKENVSWHKSIIIYAGNIEYIEDFDGDFKRCALKDIYELNQIIEIIGSILHIDGDGSQFLADDGTYKAINTDVIDDETTSTIKTYSSSKIVDLLDEKQNTLTAGDGILIENNVISVSYPNGDTEVYGNE